MSVIIQGSQLREIAFGVQVKKAAQTLPQTATADLYTVSGGSVLVTSLFGQVSGTATGATATTLKLGMKPTVGTAESAGIATAEAITSLEIGTWIGVQAASVVSGTPDTYTIGKLAVADHAGTTMFAPVPFVVPAGTITWTTSANDTGKIAWYLTYVPLDTGASVS